MKDATLPGWMELLPSAKAKLLVDLSNSLAAANDHLKVQQRASGPFQRIREGITGDGRHRATTITSHQQSVLCAIDTLVHDLGESVAASNHAIAQAAERLHEAELALEATVDFAADTRDSLRALTKRFDHERDRIDRELARIDLRISARDHLERVIARWNAGGLRHLSIAARCYVSLSDLYWGAFGDWFRRQREDHGLLQELAHKAMAQMQKDAGVAAGERAPAARWMSDAALAPHTQWREALAYQGDWAQPQTHPTVYVCSQLPPATDWPLTVPRLCSAERLTLAMVREVFPVQAQR